MPVSYSTAGGALTIGGVAMFCPAWKVINLQDLWTAAEQRGRDVVIPGASGVRPRRRRDTVTERTLRMLIVGDVDRTGAASSTKLSGLGANILFTSGALTGTVSADGVLDAVDIEVTGVTPGPELDALVVYLEHAGGSALVCYIDSSTDASLPITLVNTTFGIRWNELGICKI